MNNETRHHHDLTIVVNTCDTYHDVLGIFFYALKKFWPDCPYPVVINTETNSHPQYPARVHNYRSTTGIDDWGDRLLLTLNSIETDFVLMLYDDFILDAKVNNSRIQQALSLLKSQTDAVVTYLIDTSLPLVSTTDSQPFIPLKANVDYKLNSAPGIWHRQGLMAYTRAGDTPWAWEVFGTYRTYGDSKIFYSLNPSQLNIYPYNHAKGGAIYRGKWVREVVAHMDYKDHLNIDWSKRGFSSDTVIEKRSLMWKIRFIQTGLRMVGLKALYVLVSYVREKFRAN